MNAAASELYIEGVVFKEKKSPTGRTGKRLLSVVRIDGVEYNLQDRMFIYLVKLAMRRIIDSPQDGLVHASELEPNRIENAAKFIYRLRQQVPCLNIMNNCAGSYWLEFPAERIKFNRKKLAEYPHQDIKNMFHE